MRWLTRTSTPLPLNSWRTSISLSFHFDPLCASAVIKWHFSKFALMALRFLKNLILWLILLNSECFLKYTIHQLSINGEIKNSTTLSEVLYYLFLLCLFWLDFYYIILFQETQFGFLYSKKRQFPNPPILLGFGNCPYYSMFIYINIINRQTNILNFIDLTE